MIFYVHTCCRIRMMLLYVSVDLCVILDEFWVNVG